MSRNSIYRTTSDTRVVVVWFRGTGTDDIKAAHFKLEGTSLVEIGWGGIANTKPVSSYQGLGFAFIPWVNKGRVLWPGTDGANNKRISSRFLSLIDPGGIEFYPPSSEVPASFTTIDPFEPDIGYNICCPDVSLSVWKGNISGETDKSIYGKIETFKDYQ